LSAAVARLEDLPPIIAERALARPCPVLYDELPWVVPPALDEARLALVSTAGVHLRGADAFATTTTDYRVIPGGVGPDDLVMSHSSVNFDRSGFYEDLDVVFPIERLRELERDGAIGSLAAFHYAVMGAGAEPALYEASARAMAGFLRDDGVQVVLLVPV
jgi:D-proline reductase (dithiol) PrdB